MTCYLVRFDYIEHKDFSLLDDGVIKTTTITFYAEDETDLERRLKAIYGATNIKLVK